MRLPDLLVVVSLFFVVPGSACADWTSFRNGGESRADSDLPVRWSPESGIAWQRELPGYGQSSPVIRDGRLFVTAVAGPMKERLVIACISLKDGALIWSYEQPAANQGASNYMASRAAPTPAVDEAGVYAFFESGDVVAVDLDGKLRWKRDLTADFGEFDNHHGLGSSIAQSSDTVFINIEHHGPSYLLALAKATGATTWRTDRDSSSSWSSPLVANVQERPQVIVSSGGSVVGYSQSDGKQLWKVGELEGNSVPSPTLDGSRLLVGARIAEFTDGSGNRSNCCLDLTRLSNGKVGVQWSASRAISDYASPVVCQGNAYFVNKLGALHCLDAATGEIRYTQRLDGECWATPVVTDSLVYFFRKDGGTRVLRAGPAYKLVAENRLWDPATPPKPETYVEHQPKRGGHGGPTRGGGGLASALLAADANKDGVVTLGEAPERFRGMFPRGDADKNGELDEAEIEAMSKSFAARRAESRNSARDPIVYGAAASAGAIVVRTGTRLYCIQRTADGE